MRWQGIGWLFGMMVLLSSCSVSRGPKGLEAYREYDRPAKLPKNPSSVVVKVSLSQQRAYVLEGSEMLLAMPVSVGEAKSPTPTGEFRILEKSLKRRDVQNGFAYRGGKAKRTSLGNKPAGWSFKGAPLPYWCRFSEKLAFHTGWIRHSPCTNGNIRMHENLAPKFYRLVSVGTPVSIAWAQPEDGAWSRMPLPPDAGPLPDEEASFYLGDEAFTRHKTPGFE